MIKYKKNQSNFGCSSNVEVRNASTQTSEIGTTNRLTMVLKKFNWNNIADLNSILIDSLGIWNSIYNRIFSVIFYLVLRLLNVSFESTREILANLRLMGIQRCHEWALTIIDEDDLCVVLRDKRGSYKRITFYEEFPELEKEARAFCLSQASLKQCVFNVQSLANFIDRRFRELYPEVEIDQDELVRSEESCRADLLKWEAKYDSNTNRPYFEGHEREDVLKYRKEFITYLLDSKDYFYIPKKENGEYSWIKPMRKQKILICHDESIFRSGEISKFRWFFPEKAPFYNKGKGRSIMVSFFMVCHDQTDVFELNQEEYDEAVGKFPELEDDHGFVNYLPRSANAWIEPKKDMYFDNDLILEQFKRLFIFMRFKRSFLNYQVEVIVDNARTHSAKIYDVRMFNKFPGTNCIYDEIKWMEGDQEKM
jgi:hypothetical protein